jgi:hypothetical protein
MSKKLLFALIVLAMLLTACGSAAMPEPEVVTETFTVGRDDFAYEDQAVGSAAPAYSADTASINVEALPIERLVIKNAELDIVALDPASKMDEISQMAESMGGFVVSSSMYQRTLANGGQVPQVSITVRVPVERLDEAVAQIKTGVVRVDRENTSGQDVTQEYTDLQSQLRNLEAAEAQLTEIMEAATKTEDVLSVYNELVYKREQIEIIKGRMQYLEQSAALSKIDVSITADEAAQPLQIAGWQPGGVAKDAIEALIETLQFLGNAAIWFGLCVLPIGLIIGLPLYFAGRAVVRTRKRRKAAKLSGEVLPKEE